MALLLKIWILCILGYLTFGGDNPPMGLMLLFVPFMWPYLLAITVGPVLVLWLIASMLHSLLPAKKRI